MVSEQFPEIKNCYALLWKKVFCSKSTNKRDFYFEVYNSMQIKNSTGFAELESLHI